MTPTLDLRRPFLRSDAIAAGIGANTLRGPRFVRLLHGVYLDASVKVTPRTRAAAALLSFPATAFASHVSAARVHGVPVPTLPEEHVSVFLDRDRRRRAGVRCHLVREAEVVVVDGLRVSACCRMFVELAELLPLVDLVVAGDHLVRSGRVAVAQLRASCRGTAAAEAAGFVRERVDSPMETRLRMLLVLAGLPEPEVNLLLRDADGRPVRKHDLTYRRSRTVIEYDGRPHVEREGTWENDIKRREETESDGVRMVVVVGRDIYVDPAGLLARIHQILRQRGEPGLPARLSDGWRPHFPGRG